MVEKRCIWADTHKSSKENMSWHNKLLTYEEWYLLLCNVLQSMPVYPMSSMNPSKKVIDQLHKFMARFFGDRIDGSKGKHWIAWNELCYPKEEGGVDFKFFIQFQRHYL